MAWQDIDFGRPSRSDYYLMQIAREVAYVLSGFSDKPIKRAPLSDFRLEAEQKPTTPALTDEEQQKRYMARSKAAWMAWANSSQHQLRKQSDGQGN